MGVCGTLFDVDVDVEVDAASGFVSVEVDIEEGVILDTELADVIDDTEFDCLWLPDVEEVSAAGNDEGGGRDVLFSRFFCCALGEVGVGLVG